MAEKKRKGFRDSVSAKTLSVLCSAVMAFGMTPASAFADPAGGLTGAGSGAGASERFVGATGTTDQVAAQLTFATDAETGGTMVTDLSNKDEATYAEIPATYEGKPVTTIDWIAFGRGCPNLESVTVPEGVTQIRDQAFSNCPKLKSISLPSTLTYIGRYAFHNDGTLESITIPDGVQSIQDHTFDSCSSLTSVSLPSTVTSIGDWAFGHCTSLTSIDIPSSVTKIGSMAFSGCTSLGEVVIPDSVTSIGPVAFTASDSPNLVFVCSKGSAADTYAVENNISVRRPGQQHVDGRARFSFSTDIQTGEVEVMSCLNKDEATYAEIPTTYKGRPVTSVGQKALADCPNLESVTLPEGVTTIGNQAFADCPKLEDVTLPAGVTTIGERALANCPKLKSISLPSTLTYIGRYAFLNDGTLGSIAIPEGVQNIREGTFVGCSSLTSVSLPSTVTSIRGSAFESCTSLASIDIPSSVTEIYSQAFSGCSSLGEITIPDSVSYIGPMTFRVADSPNLVFVCSEGSTADTYATENNIPVKRPKSAAAQAVIDQIEALPEASAVTEADRAAIEAARAAYDALSDADKASVSDYGHLTAAEEALKPAASRVERLAGAPADGAAGTAAAIAAEAFAGETVDTVVIARNDDYHDALAGSGLAGALNAPILLTDRYGLSAACADEVKELGAKHAIVLGGESAVTPQVALDLEDMGISVDRVAGQDVYGTSMAINERLVSKDDADQENAVVVNPTTFADALSISGWAYANKTPVMLQTWGDTSTERGFDDEAKAILADRNLIVCGGEGAVSTESVEGLGASSERLGGDTIYDTSRSIADWELSHGMSAKDVIVASAIPDYNGVDALAGSALAGRRGGVTLLAQSNERFGWYDGGETAVKFVSDHASDIQKVHVLGGEVASTSALYSAIEQTIGEDADAED